MDLPGPPRPPATTRAGLLHVVRDSPPLVSLALGLLAGDMFAGASVAIPAALLAAVAGVATVLLFVADRVARRVGIALLACVAADIAAVRVYHPRFPSDHIATAPDRVPVIIDGILSADPESLGDRVRFWLDAERIDDGRGWRQAHGVVVLWVREVEQRWSVGDRVYAQVTLRRPRNAGNPGEFDLEAYWARRGVYVTAFADGDWALDRVGHVDGGLAERLARWRRGVGDMMRRSMPEPEAAVLSALIVGTQGELPRELRAAFSRAGVSHVLSISGLHVGLVAGAGYAAVRWLLARSRWLLLAANVPKLAAGLSVVPVLLYAGIAGSNVATTRSVIMVIVFAGAVLVDRQRHLIASLALAVCLILVSAPGSALDISFQLSFVAVLGLVLGLERFWPWWKRWEEARLVRLRRGWVARLARPVAVYVVVSLSALAATMPLTALHFNQISLVALVANAVVLPLLGSAAVILGLVAAMSYLVWQPLAQFCLQLAVPVVWLGVRLVELCAAIPYAAVHVVTPTALELMLTYGGLLAMVRLFGRARRLALTAVAIVALGDAAWWYAERYRHGDLRVTFLSVGQGECAVVELPGGEVMIVDGGGSSSDTFDIGERVVAPFLWSRKIAHVDYLVLSHPHWDHFGGLIFLAGNFSPREFWSNTTTVPSEPFARLVEALRGDHVQMVSLARGDRRVLGATEVVVHSPPPQMDGLSVNDQSLVLNVAFQGRRVLFTGDAEMAAEEEMVASADGTLASAVVMVPHHGSPTSSSGRFLDAVAPQLAVISDGFQNPFGFPAGAVLRRYEAHHCAIARTDLDGAVEVRISERGDIAVHTPNQRGVPSASSW